MKRVPGSLIAGCLMAVGWATGGCSSRSAPPAGTPTCDEFPASLGALSLDANTTAFLDATVSLVNLADNVEAALQNACAGIATDLMVVDTWTAKGPLGGGTVEAEVTEACNQASRAMAGAFGSVDGDAGTALQAPCVLSASGGGCTVDPGVQATCVSKCSGGATCTAPTVTADCAATEIIGLCSGPCVPNGTCRGSVDTPAQCDGSCSAQCSGECDGTTSSPALCSGKCSGNCAGTCGTSMMTSGSCTETCNGTCDARCVLTNSATVQCSGVCKGTCTGDCKLDSSAMVSCGAGVRCAGGCSGAYTAPSCTGRLSQPGCGADPGCLASCQSSALVSASCEAPIVSLVCMKGLSGGTLQTLTSTLQANVPTILEVAEMQGPLAMQAAESLSKTGAAIVTSGDTVSAKAMACASVAGKAASIAQTSMTLVIAVSANVRSAANRGTRS